MAKAMWVITIIGAIIGALVLSLTLTSAEGAPQEAAGAAIALSFTIIPYCIARAVSEIQTKNNV